VAGLARPRRSAPGRPGRERAPPAGRRTWSPGSPTRPSPGTPSPCSPRRGGDQRTRRAAPDRRGQRVHLAHATWHTSRRSWPPNTGGRSRRTPRRPPGAHARGRGRPAGGGREPEPRWNPGQVALVRAMAGSGARLNWRSPPPDRARPPRCAPWPPPGATAAASSSGWRLGRSSSPVGRPDRHHADTLALLTHALTTPAAARVGRPHRAHQPVIIDEAGMADTLSLDQVVGSSSTAADRCVSSATTNNSRDRRRRRPARHPGPSRSRPPERTRPLRRPSRRRRQPRPAHRRPRSARLLP